MGLIASKHLLECQQNGFYYLILTRWINASEKMCAYLLKQEVISKAIKHFIFNEEIQMIMKQDYRANLVLDRVSGCAVETISLLVQRCMPEELPPGQLNAEKLHPLSPADKFYLYHHDFWYFHISYNNGIKYLVQIISHMCYNELFLTERIVQVVQRILNKNQWKKYSPCLKIIRALLALNDNYAAIRAEWLIGTPVLKSQRYGDTEHFGGFILNTKNDQVLTFQSPLCTNDSSCMLSYMLRAIQEDMYRAVKMIRALVGAALSSEAVLKHLAQLPSPFICYAKLTDIFPVMHQK